MSLVNLNPPEKVNVFTGESSMMEFMTFPQPLTQLYHLRGPSMALPPVAVLALNLALDGPKSTASVVSAKDLACRIRQRLGMEAEVPLKTAPWNGKWRVLG